MNHSLQIADIVKYGDKKGRIVCFIKEIPDPLFGDFDENDVHERIMRKVLQKQYDKEKARREEQGLPANGRKYYEFCEAKDATHVEIVNVSGAMAKIEDVEFLRQVDWKPEHIADEIESSKLLVGHKVDYVEWF